MQLPQAIEKCHEALGLPCCFVSEHQSTVHQVLKAFWWEYVKAVNCSSVTGWMFYKQVCPMGTFHSV